MAAKKHAPKAASIDPKAEKIYEARWKAFFSAIKRSSRAETVRRKALREMTEVMQRLAAVRSAHAVTGNWPVTLRSLTDAQTAAIDVYLAAENACTIADEAKGRNEAAWAEVAKMPGLSLEIAMIPSRDWQAWQAERATRASRAKQAATRAVKRPMKASP